MLHIILLILKIIGWILLAILGIMVLLLCITLFVPMRYRGEASCKGTLDSLYGRLRFSWLFHLISGYAVYEGGKLDWAVRIAWKKMRIEDESPPEDEEFPYEAENTSDLADLPETDGQRAELSDSEGNKPEEVMSDELPAKSGSGIADEKQLEPLMQGGRADEAAGAGAKQDAKLGFFQKIRELVAKIFGKTGTIYKKLKYTFLKFCGTIKSLLEKKDKLEEFITDEVHRSALFAALAEIRRLLRYLKPKKLQADIHFGFENPAITGNVLALISMVYPFIESHADIRPDFEQKILEGNLLIAGKVRTHYAAVILWNLVWNKDVRTTFRHIRKFSL